MSLRRPAWSVCAITLVIAWVAGCSNLDTMLTRASEGAPKVRHAALDDLQEQVRDLVAAGPETAADRAKINEFLLTQFQRDQNLAVGGDPLRRVRLLDIALQGVFPCAPTLVALGARDPSALVRKSAVQGMDEAPPDELRTLLTDLLLKDPEFVVRLEAAKTFGYVGSADWVEPLVRVILNSTEDASLSYQAHLSACRLIGETIPNTPTDWRAWLEREE